MKISEWIEMLQYKLDMHGDVEVKATFEGCIEDIEYNQIYLGHDCMYTSDLKDKQYCEKYFPNKVLYIDVDDNFYKDELAIDSSEGDDYMLEEN